MHDHLDLDVYRGEVLGVVGGSGTGKSVLMRSVIGLNEYRSGTIEVFGRDIAGLSEAGWREIEQRWGVLFQEGALFSSQSIAENIQVPMREYLNMPQELMNEIASMKLSMVGLDEVAAPIYLEDVKEQAAPREPRHEAEQSHDGEQSADVEREDAGGGDMAEQGYIFDGGVFGRWI